MPHWCIAYGCNNSSDMAVKRSWHRLPLENQELLSKWIANIPRTNTPINEHSRLCGDHFEAECFKKVPGSSRIGLKTGSIPTKFCFVKEKQPRKPPKERTRVGMLEQDLAVRFELSQSHVSRIITTWVNAMYHRLKKVDIWSTREQALTNFPEKVREFCPTLRCIIDATEIYIEQPKNPEAQQLTFSTYKNHNTLKSLIGINGNGVINFVSCLEVFSTFRNPHGLDNPLHKFDSLRVVSNCSWRCFRGTAL